MPGMGRPAGGGRGGKAATAAGDDAAADLRAPLLGAAAVNGGAPSGRQHPQQQQNHHHQQQQQQQQPASTTRHQAEVEDDLEAGLHQAPQTASVWRLLREASPEAGTLAVATLFLLASSLASLAVPKVAGVLVDACTRAASGALTPSQARAVLDQQLLLVLAIMAGGGLASGLRAYLFGAAAERVMTRLRVQLFSRLVRQETAFFDVTPVGELSSRLSEDTRAMRDACTTSISMLLRSLLTTVLGAAAMFLTSWRLALLTCATLPVMLVQFRIYARFNKKAVAEQLKASAAASAAAQEVLAGIRTVKSFAKERHAVERYSKACSAILAQGMRMAAASGLFIAISVPCAYASMMLVLWYGATLVLGGAMSVGDLNAFMLYAIYVSGSAGGLASTISQLITAVGAGKRVFQLIDREPALPPAGTATPPMPAPAGASLELKDVDFAYPSRPSALVLRGFSLSLQPGQSVALVGPSGGGKTTVAKLVQRFYDPRQGTILLNGVPLPAISNEYLHSAVAMVAQEPLVFADSIRANILFGTHRRGVTDAEIEAAAMAAHAHEFIQALPAGYNSKVGEQGVLLSGGQKQRLAIARALLVQPQLLLLDEATSALDSESEHLVQQALQEAAKQRSVLVIAHRLSTVSSCDVVAVVHEGCVAESGSHEQLVAQPGGVYAQLVKRQVFSRSDGEASFGNGAAAAGAAAGAAGQRPGALVVEVEDAASPASAASAAAAPPPQAAGANGAAATAAASATEQADGSTAGVHATSPPPVASTSYAPDPDATTEGGAGGKRRGGGRGRRKRG